MSAPLTPHSNSEMYRRFQHQGGSVYSNCVVCFGRLAIHPLSDAVTEIPVGHDSGVEGAEPEVWHLVHSLCIYLFLGFKGGCPVCDRSLQFEDLRTGTSNVPGRLRPILDENISVITQKMWQEVGCHRDIRPLPLWKPYLILSLAQNDQSEEMKQLLTQWEDIPLHICEQAVRCAALSGSLSIIQLFLEMRPHVDHFRISQEAFYYAAKAGQLSVVEWLLQRGVGEIDHRYVIASLGRACRKGHIALCKLLFHYCKQLLSYRERVLSFLSCNPTRSELEEMIFLLQGENFDEYSEKEISELKLCLDCGFGSLSLPEKRCNGQMLLGRLMHQMNSRDKTRSLLQGWLDSVPPIDQIYLLLEIVLSCEISLGSVARGKFVSALLLPSRWRWLDPKVVLDPNMQLDPETEVDLNQAFHPEFLAYPQNIGLNHNVPHPNVHFLLCLRDLWRKSRDLVTRLLSLPGEAISSAKRGEALCAAVINRDRAMVELIIQDGEISPGAWRESRARATLPEIIAVLERHRPYSVALFLEGCWTGLVSWLARKWRALRQRYL